MNCPSCHKNSAYLDHEVLNGKDGFPIVGVLSYCPQCQTSWSKRFITKHKNPSFVDWLVNDIKSKSAPAPQEMKFSNIGIKI
jgi:hypothetical protein